MRARWIVAALALLVLGLAAVVSRAGANPGITVVIDRHGAVQGDGQFAVVGVTVTCDAPGSVLEAFLQVGQRHASTFGEGGMSNVVCDGVPHESVVTAQATSGAYTPGPARGSAFVLVCDQQDNCQQGQAIGHISLRRTPPTRR